MGYPVYDKLQSTTSGHNIPVSWMSNRLKFVVTYNDESLSETTDPDTVLAYVDISSVNLIDGITFVNEIPFEKAPSRARRIVKDGDTIISTVRTYLKAIAGVRKPPENLIVSTGFAVIRPSSKIDSEFLAFFLQSQYFVDDVVANSVGVSYPAINATDLVCLPIVFPQSSTEQQQIAKFLDYKTGQIDQLIAKKKVLIEKLGEKRVAVITYAVTRGLDSTVPMRDSEVEWLGEVPEHWECIKLRFLLKGNFVNGIFKKAEHWGTGTRIVNVTDLYIHNDLIIEEELDRLECDTNEIEKFSALHGDFFFVRSSLKLEGIGKSASIVKPTEEMVFECHVVRGRPDLEMIDSRFLNLYLNSKYSRDYFVSRSNQVTMTTIDQDKFKTLNITLPPYQEQIDIVSMVDDELLKIDSTVTAASKVIAKLKEYRTALITAAVTGKIDVRDVEVPQEA